jgi:hypothetical protein
MAEKKKMSPATSIACLLVIAVAIYLAWPSKDEPATPQQFIENNRPSAYTAAQQFVKQKLQAPATAAFPEFAQSMCEYTMDSTYVITSYVEAANNLGTQSRTTYTCKLKYSGTDNWKCVYCYVD